MRYSVLLNYEIRMFVVRLGIEIIHNIFIDIF